MKIIAIMLFFLISFDFIRSGEDYYALLGVARNATEDQIKKAFKKMSIKYHPDKNKDRKEWATDQFVKIAAAYETLSDPEKRRQFDIGGEEAVKKHEQNKAQGGTYEDIFGRVFRQNTQYTDEDIDERQINHFPNSDVLEVTIQTLTKLLARNEIWFVLCYKNSDRGMKETVEMWKTLGEKTYGIFKIGYINCKKEEELCDEFEVRETTTILYFPEVGEDPQVYIGVKTWEKIFQYGSGLMQSFVRVVNDNNYGDFITSNPSNHKAILFTSKKVTPPLLKALSKRYQGKLYLGEVRQSETELVQRFGIQKFPTLILVSEGENHKGVEYDGPMTRDSIERFLNKFAYETLKVETKPGEILELDDGLYNRRNICNHLDGKNICVLFIVKSGQELLSDDHQRLAQLSERFVNDPFKFVFVPIEQYGHFWSSFNSEDLDSDIIVIKGKRKRYLSIKFEDTNWTQKVEDTLDLIVSGGGSFYNMIKKLNLVKLVNIKEDM